MPLYTFACVDCLHVEVLPSAIAERDAPRACNQCEGHLQRRIDAGQGLQRSIKREATENERRNDRNEPESEQPRFARLWREVEEAAAKGGPGTGGILHAGKNSMFVGINIEGPLSLPAVEIVGNDSDATIVDSSFVDARTAIQIGDGAKVRADNVKQTFTETGRQTFSKGQSRRRWRRRRS
jgi:putative FmdB family regulatory protein